MFCNLRIFTLTRLGMPVMGSKPDLFASFREACMGGRWDIRKRSFEFPSPAFSQPLTAYTRKLFLPETRRLATTTVTQDGDRGWNRTCVPIDINPFITTQPVKGFTTPPVSTPPTLYEQQCEFFYFPQELEQRKSCETGPTAFRPYPRRLECLTFCRC